MADENKSRPYRSDTYGTRGAPATEGGRASSGDPLAELARLIGQDDLFEPTRRNAPPQRAAPRYDPFAETDGDVPARPDPRASAAGWGRASQSIEDELRGTYGASDAASAAHRLAAGGAAKGYADYAASARPDNVRAARRAQRQYEEDYEEPSPGPRAAASWHEAAPEQADPYGGHSAAYAEPAPEAQPDYAQDVVADPHYAQEEHYAAEGYEQPPRERRRGGAITAAALIGVALIGTAAAFGYRSWTGRGDGSDQPPVISALDGPNKITPSPENAGDRGSKAIYDRADKGQGERIVSREEQPMDVKPAPAAAGQNSGSAVGNGAEPRKVRTIAIRPDGSIITDASGAPVPSGTRVAHATVPPQTAAAPAPTPAPRPAPAAAPAPPTRTAALPSPSAAVPAGSYVVQLVSNKSEAEAQAAFRSLQVKYPSVLGDRQPLIRRVDLGDKGIYYRAQIGPFAAAGDANDFCGNLKAAGGQCIVQKN